MARGFGAKESANPRLAISTRLNGEVVRLKEAGDAKALKHAAAIKKNSKVIEKALANPEFAASLYAPSKTDARDYDKSIVQREVYEAYKAAGRLDELPSGYDIKELWEKHGLDANKETFFEFDKDGRTVVAKSGKYLGVSDPVSVSRYRPGHINRDGVAWHNHPDKGPDGRAWGFPPSPHDVQEMLMKGHRTWFIGTLEGTYEMTIRDSSKFRSMEGKELVSAAKKLNAEVKNIWLAVIKEAGPGCMKDKGRGTDFTNVLNLVLKQKLADAGIDYKFKPAQAGFDELN